MSVIDTQMKQQEEEKRLRRERVSLSRVAALSPDYIVLYTIDPRTGRYTQFNPSNAYENVGLAREGEDFFADVRTDSPRAIAPEDLERHLSVLTRENMLRVIRKNGMLIHDYRMLLDGKSVPVSLKATLIEEDGEEKILLGITSDETEEYRRRLEEERTVYARLHALTGNFIVVYVVDPETDRYRELSATDDYADSFAQAKSGVDFFGKVRDGARTFTDPEDLNDFLSAFTKEKVLAEIERGGIFTHVYRLMMDGRPVYMQMNAAMVEEQEGPRLIVGHNDIDAQVRAKRAQMEDQKKRVTYTQIAERLADHYDFIYYIDCENSNYTELSTKQLSGELKVQTEGQDFFTAACNNAERLIYPEDRERIRLFLNRDNLISRLESRRQLTEDYRMVVDGGKTQYTRMSVTYSSDHSHFIICVENREEDVRREKEQLEALSLANALARRDELTHTKNKTAYHEMEKELQKQVKAGGEPFGIVVCDINGLKTINDTEGHRAGDDYIKAACMLVCRIFHHSPVFRIGGDEFAVVLRGHDFEHREGLFAGLREQVEQNLRDGGPVVASGLAVFRPGEDTSVEEVFNRADSQMYEEKTRLKAVKQGQ